MPTADTTSDKLICPRQSTTCTGWGHMYTRSKRAAYRSWRSCSANSSASFTMRSISSSDKRPFSDVMVICWTFPEALSSAETLLIKRGKNVPVQATAGSWRAWSTSKASNYSPGVATASQQIQRTQTKIVNPKGHSTFIFPIFQPLLTIKVVLGRSISDTWA